ncbi:TKL protein kinase [Kwoniella mangroviensis CBS 8886]|nr:TKL protein kinase [Kwoniella mangroviensis CBS 8886]
MSTSSVKAPSLNSKNGSLPSVPQSSSSTKSRVSNSTSNTPSPRPQLLLNGVSPQDVIAESPVSAENPDEQAQMIRSTSKHSISPLTKSTRSYSGNRSVIDPLDDPFAHSIQRLEKAVDRFEMVGSGMEFVGNVLSAIPLLQTGGAIMMCLRQMLDAAKKVMENKLDALGLVSDSITIVEAVQGRIRSSTTPLSEDVQYGVEALFVKLTSNTELLQNFVGRSKFKLFLYASKMQRQIDDARNDTLMYIARFTLESIVSFDQLQQEAQVQREQDRQDFAKRLEQFIRNPESARHLIANEEVPEILVTLQREVERQYHNRYRSPGSSSPSSAAVQFPTPHPYYPPPPPTTAPQTRYGGSEAVQSSEVQAFSVDNDDLALTRQATWEDSEPVITRHGRRAWQVTTDETDIETSKGMFCQSFLKYLRSESQKSVEDLPVWTITEYEVYREQRECTSNFAKVWKGRWHDQEVAIKDLDPLTDKHLFLAEVNIWCRLDSEFVLPFFGASSAVGPPPWFLVSPWMKNGRITDYIRSDAGSKVDRIALIHRVAQGMEYLHSRDVVHGDLKGQNILIDDEGRPRLCDFGLSQIKIDITSKSANPTEGESNAGTLRFLPPERLKSSPMTKECDVYSFAMTIYQIYSGEIPFAALDAYNAKMSILEGVRPPQISDIPDQLYGLMTRCWAADPRIRPSFEEITAELQGMYNHADSPAQSYRSVPTLLDLSGDRLEPPQPTSNLAIPMERLNIGKTRTEAESTLTAQLSVPTELDEHDSRDPVFSDDESDRISVASDAASAIYLPDQTDREAPTELELERRYRKYFNYHDYSDHFNLPQWNPTIVALGDIGFMKDGRFVYLDNAIGSKITPGQGLLFSTAAPLNVIAVSETAIYPKLVSDMAKDFGVRIVSAFRTKKTRFTKAVRRQTSVPMYPGRKAVRLIVADGKMQMIRDYSKLKAYLMENIDGILKIAEEQGYGLMQKTDIVLVVGVLIANNYAMAVSDFAPGASLKFNVLSPTRKSDKEPWGFWTLARDQGDDASSYRLETSSGSSSNPSPAPSQSHVPPSPPGLPIINRRLPDVDDGPLQYSVKTSKPNGPKNEPVTATTVNKLASAISEPSYTDYYQKEVANLEKMIKPLDKFEIVTGLVGDIARTVELIAPAGAVLGMISKFFGYVKSIKTIKLEALGLVRSSVETTISIQDCLVTIEFKVPLAMVKSINKFYNYKQSSIFNDNNLGVTAQSDDFILTNALVNALQLNNDNLSDYLGINQLTIQEMISLRAILQARRTSAGTSSLTTRPTSPADQRSTASPRTGSTQQSATHQIYMVLGIRYDKADSPGLNGNVTEDGAEENSSPPRGYAKYAEGPASHGYKWNGKGSAIYIFPCLHILSQRISTDSTELETTSREGGIDEIGLIKERLLGSHAEKRSTSEVWKGSYLGKAVRIKRLDWLDHVPGATTETLSSVRQVYLKQIQLLKTMTSSPFIMRFVGAIGPTEGSSQWSIVSEYMPHGDVLAYLGSEAGRQADRHGGQAVLADFGYISELESFTPDRLTTQKNAPFIAPEVVAGGSATELSDVFAFGKTAFQILTGVAPSKPHVWPQRGPYRYNRSWASHNTVTIYEFLSRCFAEKPQHRFAIRQILGIMEKIGMTRMSDTKDFTPYSMKIRLKWWETTVAVHGAKTLPGLSDAQRHALSSKIDTLKSEFKDPNNQELDSNYSNAEPSYVNHGLFKRMPEVLLTSLPAFRANCYTSYFLVDDTVELYTLLQYVGNQMSTDSPADWLLAYEVASRRLVDNIEILRTVSACDTYVQLIFWEILHEVMWASRILTCQRLVELRNRTGGGFQSSNDQSRKFWDSLCTLTADRKLCDSILVAQLLRRGKDAGSCELLLGGRFPKDNLHLLGCVLSCEEFKSEDPKPTGFQGRLEDYPKWSSPILTMLGDLDARASHGERLVLSESTAMEREEPLLPKQEREILALVRGDDFMTYHESLQDAWDLCSAHIIEYESGFGGSQFPSLDKQALESTTILNEDDQEATGLPSNIPDKAPAKIPIDPGFRFRTTKDQSLESRRPQGLSPGETALDEDLCETDEAKQKAKAIQEMWGTLWQEQEPSTRPETSSTAPTAWQSAVPMASRIAASPDDTKDDAQSGVPLFWYTPSARWVN